MKFNKWTLGLAALGVVSLASVAQAEEKLNPIRAALESTSISGYIDTSIEANFCPHDDSPFITEEDSSWPGIPFRTDTKRNGFNLNVVKLTLQKALDEGEWASGYRFDLLVGPDAVGYNPAAESEGTEALAIKQAYIALRTPVGNGIDWKVGVFDTIIGYESFEAGNNPNFSRSWGWAVEPTQHTGLLATYRFNDNVSASAGIANTLTPGINARNDNTGIDSYWCKTYMGSIALTAPDNWGFLSGSTLYSGIVAGHADGGSHSQVNYYVGATVSTPVTGLRAGFAFDYVDNLGGAPEGDYQDDVMVIGGYVSYQATEKLSLHGRVEYGHLCYYFNDDGTDNGHEDVWGITATAQYDLWKNVISRLEFRYDDWRASWTGSQHNLAMYLNMIYSF